MGMKLCEHKKGSIIKLTVKLKFQVAYLERKTKALA
jgi:hypothetical protein